MALKFSEMMAVRADLARKLAAAFVNYSADIAQGFHAFLAPVLEEGETALDVDFQLELLRRCVERERLRLSSLDQGVVDQIQEDEKVRAELEERRDAVDGKLRRVRHVCRGVYGSDSLDRIGIAGEFPRGPVRLYELGQVVKSSLEKPDFGIEPMLELDLAGEESKSVPDQLAAQLAPELQHLGELVEGRHDERSKSTDVRLKRRQVIREFDANIRGIVRMAQGMFRLAGRTDLAARIRPTLQRVLRKLKAQEAKEDAEAQADAAADAEGAESAPTGEAAASEETTA